MDSESQATLTPNHSNQPTIQLVFSNNSTLNANLLLNGQIRYIISTKDKHAQHTQIIDGLTNSELVSIRRRTILSDKIVFANRHGGVEQKISNLMKEQKMDDGYKAHMIHTELGNCYWKIHKIHRLALFSVSDSVHPVAYRDVVSDPINTFALIVKREYEQILDYIIPTFLLLEQGLRNGEKQADIADGKVAMNRTLLGNYTQMS